jgi:hypothetical protein
MILIRDYVNSLSMQKVMKWIAFSLLPLLLWGSRVSLSGQNWDWARSSTAFTGNSATDVAADPQGNVYITGYFFSTAQFGDSMITSNGSSDIFLAKYDPQGSLIWVRQAGGSGEDQALGIALDPSGNILLTGFFRGNAFFDGIKITSVMFEDIFTVKYSPSGNALWAQSAGGSLYDHGQGITADAVGNVYVTGYYQGTATFSDTILTNTGAVDIFISKYSPSGGFLWARKAGGSSDDRGFDLTVVQNDLFVTGYFTGWATFGNGAITLIGSAKDMFMARYSTSGSFIQAVKAGGNDNEEGKRITSDDAGNLYIAGYFKYNATFGSVSMVSSGGKDIFLARYAGSGLCQWVRQAGGTSDDEGLSLTMLPSSEIAISGYFAGLSTFGNDTLLSSGSTNLFVAIFDSSGILEKVVDAGGTATETASGIATGGGAVFSAGQFLGNPVFGNDTLSGSFQTFVARLSYCTQPDLALPVSGDTLCQGTYAVVQLPFSEAGIQYQAGTGNQTVGVPVTGPGSLTFLIPVDSLLTGPNSIWITASVPACLTLDTLLIRPIIQLNPVPTAAFSWDIAISSPGAMFFDSSLVAGDSLVYWYWDFGDGTTSTDAEPVHLFPSGGSYQVCLTVTTAGGCSDSTCNWVMVLTSLDPEKDSGLKLWPNPATENGVMIEFLDGRRHSGHIELWNQNGQVLIMEHFRETHNLPLQTSQLTSGLYFLMVQSEFGQAFQKLLIP